MAKKYKHKGKKYKISKSNRKNKQHKVKLPNGEEVHFGDPDMKEFPGTKRGDNYCARSLGIAKQHDKKGDITSPNFWSRQMWSCKGKESKSKKKFFGKLK
ncbi:MAG: hypothetical protein ACOC1X_02670 [Promethearchaeota archaeon]